MVPLLWLGNSEPIHHRRWSAGSMVSFGPLWCAQVRVRCSTYAWRLRGCQAMRSADSEQHHSWAVLASEEQWNENVR